MTVAALAALALTAGDCRLPPLRDGALPWRPGEKLAYDIDIMGIVKAGAVTLEAQRPAFRGTQVPVAARLRNTSIFAKVRKIQGSALTWMDASTLLPERYRDEVLENGVRKISDTRMGTGSGEVTVENQYGERKEVAVYGREREVLDAISALYYLRAAQIEAGQEICFDLVATRRYWRARGKVAQRPERVESAAGLFDTLRIDLTVTRADKPEVRRRLHLWFSTDPRRLFVAAVTEIDLGPVRVILSRAPAP